MITVALNTQTALGQKSGFGSYVDGLSTAMSQVDPEISYIPLTAPGQVQNLSTLERIQWDQFGFPLAARKSQAHIVHQPSFSAPIFHNRPSVVTIHDIIPLLFPENFSPPSRFFFTKVMPFSYRFTDHFLTISQWSKKDLIEKLGLPEDKITVTYLASHSHYQPLRSSTDREKIASLKKKYAISGDYFLHIGTLEPRKNLLFLLEAFAGVLAQLPEGFQLVITGKKGWGYEELFAKVKQYDLEKRVIFTGYADLEELPYLLNGATALLFPSLYEGFGLPPLDALQCGTPVIASNASSVPEVVGEAAILLSPTDLEGWQQAMRHLADPENSNMRRKLSQQGLEQAKHFSWEITAKQTAAAYRNLLSL